MIELGAGYGRWLANAVGALKQSDNLPYILIGVEPEPTHFKWLKQHLRLNGVDLSRCQLLKAAASAHDGTVWFYTGRPAEWYGQAVAQSAPDALPWVKRLRGLWGKAEVQVKKVRSISLNSLLQPLRTVDLIDLDVQGAELNVLESAAEQVDGKVKRVHVGTHSAETESGLRQLFQGLGWEKVNDYACGSESDTPFGVIKFQDGVQTWINPKL
jgi:FkbM family methyltransferase